MISVCNNILFAQYKTMLFRNKYFSSLLYKDDMSVLIGTHWRLMILIHEIGSILIFYFWYFIWVYKEMLDETILYIRSIPKITPKCRDDYLELYTPSKNRSDIISFFNTDSCSITDELEEGQTVEMETTENYSRLTYEHFEAKFINIGGLPDEIHAPIHIPQARQLRRSGESIISRNYCK